MKYATTAGTQNDRESKDRMPYVPVLEQVEPVGEPELKDYLKALQKYFISGEKTGRGLKQEVYPIKYAPYLKRGETIPDFPVFYDAQMDAITSFYSFLGKSIDEEFEPEAAAMIQKELPEIYNSIQKMAREGGKEVSVPNQAEVVIKALQALDLPAKDPDTLASRIHTIQDALLKQTKILFGFSGKTAFQLLSLPNGKRRHLQSKFLETLKRITAGLHDLLWLESGRSSQFLNQMDFAEELISLEKIREIAASSVSSHLPASRLKRLRWALKVLQSAQESYARSGLTLYTSDEIKEAFDLKEIFPDANIITTSGNSCAEARSHSQKEVHEFVQTIAALKVGKRMIEQNYEDHLHDPYFDQFDLTFLAEDELQYLPPTLVIENSRQIMQQSGDFLDLVGKDSFVKVLGINSLDDLWDIQNPDGSDHLELASLAIFRRNSYVFQGGLESPSRLYASFKKGIAFPGAAFWNVLVPGENAEKDRDYFALLAAVESRFFPRLEYEPEENRFAGNQIKLETNPNAEAYAATYQQEIQYPSGVESLDMGFTIAEFLAMDLGLKETLEIISPGYESPNHLPLNEHLSQKKDLVPGKIPFVWVVDEQDKLRKAAVPVSWVEICRSRRNYWAFLQEISGITQTHRQETLETARTEWEEEKKAEIKSLKFTLQEQFEKERSTDIQQAIVRILHGLLNEEGSLENRLTEIGEVEKKPGLQPKAKTERPPVVPAREEQEEEEEGSKAPITGEAWVESDECTSCQDCVDALPSVFKYNEEKQAYVHNPKGSTFAQIVKAAEKCPARCIHPGAPQNKNEEGLDKWVKRAEKFN